MRVCPPALTLIAGSRLSIDLRPVLPDAVPILASFLRKNQRALKLCTLAALDILLRNYRYLSVCYRDYRYHLSVCYRR